MQQASQYSCPACGSFLVFGSKSQQLECQSCGNTYPLEVIEQAAKITQATSDPPHFQWENTENSGFDANEGQKLRAFRCQNCGAEILADDTTAATECVYCGNPSILPGVLSGAYRPDGVIPFQKSRKEAQEAFKNHCKSKKLLPNGFYDDSRLEKITGVYVPFWLYQADAEADCTYKATKVAVRRQGNYEITSTSHFLVHRGGHLGFNEVPVDGSSKMDDAMMESIEPFNAGEAQEFQTGYLTGFQAQRHDMDDQECQPRANERIQKSVAAAMAATVKGYSSVTPVNNHIELSHGKVRQVLMPVWMLNTRWQDKTYTFAMNGQTGLFIGDLPTDKKKFWTWLLGLTFGIGVGGCALAYLLFTAGVI